MISHLCRSQRYIVFMCLFVVSSFSSAAIRISVTNLNASDTQQIQSWIIAGSSSTVTHSSLNVLREINQHTDANQVVHRRLQQEYLGVPVYGGYIILHQHKQALIPEYMNGSVYKDLESELGDLPQDFTQHAQQVLADFKLKFSSEKVIDEKIQPIVYVDEKQIGHWAYRVSVLLQPQDAFLHRPTMIIDASRNIIYQQWNSLNTLKAPVMASGYGGNPKMGYYQYGKQLPLLQISRDHFAETCYMENKLVRVVDVGFQYDTYSKPMSFECLSKNMDEKGFYWTGYSGDGFDFINEAFSPSNDAMYIGGVIQALYHDWYHVDALSTNKKPMQLIMRVHYGKQYENAFWDGRMMTFGDGRNMLYPLVALDVGAHEVSHGFTEQHSGLEYYDQSGGMNESFSDMAGKVAEYYVQGYNNWSIGASIMKNNQVLRYLDNPSLDGRSIENINQYVKGMDVHYLSGVYNRLFYLLSTQAGWNPRIAFNVMLKANMDYWTPTSTFAEGACGVLFATKDLNLNVSDVLSALEQVGLGNTEKNGVLLC